MKFIAVFFFLSAPASCLKLNTESPFDDDHESRSRAFHSAMGEVKLPFKLPPGQIKKPLKKSSESCANNCDSQALDGCWCDNVCLSYGDCCKDFCFVCQDYTCLNPPNVMAKADPKMTNLAGEHFDLRAMGTFKFLELTDASDTSLLSLDASIERAGESSGEHAKTSKCATYVTRATMTGKWMEKEMRVQVNPRLYTRKEGLKAEGVLQVYADGEWSNSTKQVRKISQKEMLAEISLKKVTVEVRGAKVIATLNFHHPRVGGRYVDSYFPFLDLEVRGLADLEKSGIRVRGLLGRDDHAAFTIPSDECKPSTTAKDISFAKRPRTREDLEQSGLLSTCKAQ